MFSLMRNRHPTFVWLHQRRCGFNCFRRPRIC